ncbi:MAG: Flp pilus assembly protein CpaB [Acetobacter sp.]|nr:Flp pilus assembly protein CpaB [Acetobacter sp.]
MNPKVMLFLFFGVGIVGVVMFIHTTKPALLKPAPPKKVYVHVLFAKHNLRIGHLIKVNDLTEKTYLLGKQPFGSVLATQQVMGSVVSVPVAAGDVIVNGDLISPDEPSFLSYALPSGEGAVSIVLTSQNAVDSFVQPGDRVDVFVRTSGRLPSAQIALRNVLVLSINHNLGKKLFVRETESFMTRLGHAGETQSQAIQQATALQQASSNVKPSVSEPSLINPDKPLVVTLEVTPEEAAVLMHAMNMGILSLMLRSAQNNNETAESSVVAGSMVIYNGPTIAQ